MPRFSIVIPTLQRSDTLRHALATAVHQAYDDFEIVVQNNGHDDKTEAVIASFNDRRIRHFWSDAILPMTENWETALANTTGEFVTFIGDDDGLFPDACRVAAEIFARTDVEILSWRQFMYYWPNHINSALCNRLIADVDYDVGIRLISSWDQLRRFYGFVINYSQLPMIYNSFVGRRVIERVKAHAGRYFLGNSPDVTSGLVNAACTKEFAVVTRPLSMSGVSGHSTGHNAALSPPGWAIPERVKRELDAVKYDARLVPANNLEIGIAGDALLVRDKFFEDDRRIEFDFRRLIQTIAAAINDRPGFYEATHAAIETLADRHGIALSDIAIPRQTNAAPRLSCCARAHGPRQVLFVIDGNAVGLKAIDDAIRLAEQIMPRVEDVGTLEIRTVDTLDRAIARPGAKVAFCVGGDGVPGLDYGWGNPEWSGTWSVAKQAQLRLLTQSGGVGPINVDIAFRPFLHGDHSRIDVTFCANGNELATLACDRSDFQVFRLTIPAGSVGADGNIDLELRISDPRSPLELGFNADQRMLGICLEWIMINRSG